MTAEGNNNYNNEILSQHGLRHIRGSQNKQAWYFQPFWPKPLQPKKPLRPTHDVGFERPMINFRAEQSFAGTANHSLQASTPTRTPRPDPTKRQLIMCETKHSDASDTLTACQLLRTSRRRPTASRREEVTVLTIQGLVLILQRVHSLEQQGRRRQLAVTRTSFVNTNLGMTARHNGCSHRNPSPSANSDKLEWLSRNLHLPSLNLSI